MVSLIITTIAAAAAIVAAVCGYIQIVHDRCPNKNKQCGHRYNGHIRQKRSPGDGTTTYIYRCTFCKCGH